MVASASNELDSFSRFHTTPTCDRRTLNDSIYGTALCICVMQYKEAKPNAL